MRWTNPVDHIWEIQYIRWEEIRIFRDGEEEQEELGILVIGFEMKIHNEGLPG